jgi:nicotinamidase-related amidase
VALSTLDQGAALVVIDLQKGVVSLPTVHRAGDVVGNAARLARAFRAKGLPVVLVNVTGRAPGRTQTGPPKFAFPDDWAELAPELDQSPDDILVTKQRVGAFLGTRLDEVLRERRVTQVILAGISTSAGVEATARSAYDLGYHVVFVVDAMTDLDAETHRLSVERIFPRIGETATTADILSSVEAR